eukprot:scaffold15.g4212.t1
MALVFSLPSLQAPAANGSRSAQRAVTVSAAAGPHGDGRSSRRRALGGLAAAACALAVQRRAVALGLESIDLPVDLPDVSDFVKQRQESNAAVLKDAEEAFQNSDLLAKLKKRSEENKAANKRSLQDKYCSRQAELGIGDCGGLRLIPGMTQRLRSEGLQSLEGGGGGGGAEE